MNWKAVWVVVCALTLAGCAGIGKTPAPLPTVMLDQNGAALVTPAAGQAATPAPFSGGEVSASGIVVPARQAQIAAAQGGNVEAVFVTAGQRVRAGDRLIRLAGSEKLAAAVEVAQTELLAAQQDLQTLQEGAGQTAAAALLRLATANKALDEASKIRGYRQYRNGSDAMIQNAQADLILANDALERAQNGYNAVSGQDDSSISKAGALSALSAAQKARDRAVANLNYLQALPNQIEVDVVEAQLQAAQAEADAAARDYETLKNGPDPDRLALAEQRVKTAGAQLTAAQAALSTVELTAPMDGTVANLNVDPGTWVTPGQPMLVLLDLAHMQIKTTDLSERDVPAVQVGQAVEVSVKALGITLQGKVTEISPLANALGGDVVYTTTIDLLEAVPANLRAGMTADVRFLAGD